MKLCREKTRIRHGGIKMSTVTFQDADPSTANVNAEILREAIIDQGVFFAYITVFLIFNIVYFIYYAIIGQK